MKPHSILPDRPLIYLITDGSLTSQNFHHKSQSTLKLVKAAVDSGISLIQIREKNLTAGPVFDLVQRASEITSKSDTKLLVNDRADIAVLAGADGVHLTSTSVSADVARRNFPAHFIIGVSAHSMNETRRAKESGADFVVFGPIFETASKIQYGNPLGLEALKLVSETLAPFPVLGIGGVNKTNYLSVLESGAAGFAAIGFLNDTKNLRRVIADVKNEYQKRWP